MLSHKIRHNIRLSHFCSTKVSDLGSKRLSRRDHLEDARSQPIAALKRHRVAPPVNLDVVERKSKELDDGGNSDSTGQCGR